MNKQWFWDKLVIVLGTIFLLLNMFVFMIGYSIHKIPNLCNEAIALWKESTMGKALVLFLLTFVVSFIQLLIQFLWQFPINIANSILYTYGYHINTIFVRLTFIVIIVLIAIYSVHVVNKSINKK